MTITYCTQCNWLLRAAWMAQELLSTFSTSLSEVALVPAGGGTFVIAIDGAILWERKADGGFPDVKALKQRVRDRLDPGATWGISIASRESQEAGCAERSAKRKLSPRQLRRKGFRG